MRVTVLGAGAVGGWLAAGLARGGAEVAVLARGATLATLPRDGLVELAARLGLPAPTLAGAHGLVRLLAAHRPDP